jgi:hypothetical protein
MHGRRAATPVAFISALLLGVGFGATLHGNTEGRLMRKTMDEDRTVQLGAHGQLVAPPEAEQPEEAGNATSNEDFCNLDFPWGQVNSNACDKRSSHTKSGLTRAECEWAATLAGAKVDRVHETLTQEWEDKHPYGCFMYPCSDGGQCYWYNGDGATPSSPKGVPVCERPRYLYGVAVADKGLDDPDFCTKDVHTKADGEYTVIDNENACRAAASCLGNCAGSLFTTGVHNASKQEYAPPGCYLAKNKTHDTPCVYFNHATLGPPKDPVGTPICVVAKPDNIKSLPSGYGSALSGPAPSTVPAPSPTG